VARSVRFHRWGLRCRQSSFHPIMRALQDGTISVFWPLPLFRHALVPSGFRFQVNRMTQKPPFELLLTGSRIQSRVPRRTLSPHTAQHLRSFSVAHVSTKRPFAFLQLHRCPPVYSLRVRWVPLFRSSRRLGAFAMGTHPRVHGFPVRRLLCPIRLSPGASSFRETFPSHYFPTALHIPRGVSRVRHGRLKRNDVGGVFISLPRLLFAAPQALDRG